MNGVSMLFAKLLTQRSAVFADVRTYWSPEAVKRVTGYTPTGKAAGERKADSARPCFPSAPARSCRLPV